MAFTVACFCGTNFRCEPPADCPTCGAMVLDPRKTDEAWLQAVRDEIGTFESRTPIDPREAW